MSPEMRADVAAHRQSLCVNGNLVHVGRPTTAEMKRRLRLFLRRNGMHEEARWLSL